MRIVSLAGPKGSGKNTLADRIARHLKTAGHDCEQLAFADPIRWACDGLGMPFADTRGAKNFERGYLAGKCGRDMMVAVGEAVRKVAPDYWAHRMTDRLTVLSAHDHDHAIVTDTRRANEVDALAVWASRHPSHRLAKLWVARPGHDADEVLESSIRKGCVVITNDGTLADLDAKAHGIAQWMTGGAL